MDDGEVAANSRKNLESDLNDIQTIMIESLQLHDNSFNDYHNSMQKLLEGKETYFKSKEFRDLHDISKNQTMSQVWFCFKLIIIK